MGTGRTASFSIPSIIALIAAIFSFTIGAFWGVILALVALFFGVFGVLLSLAPPVRGGFLSLISIVAGLLGIVVAAFKAAAAFF
jgi:hypothetical protein